jgi:membrane-bound metal-dependent hydrolase YbcI (DUF457 family)
LDNLTHSLFAITLGRTPLGRAGRGTTAALLIASNIPDIDIVTLAGGGVSYLKWHRGPTHGPLGILGLGLISAGLAWLWQRARDKNTRKKKSKKAARAAPSNQPNASFGMLAAVSIIGVFLHVLMDLPTSYGTRILSPFDWHWFAVDWLPIVDIYLLTALGAGLVFGSLSADARTRNVVIALTLMAAIYGVRGAAHHQALALAPRLFGPTLPRPCAPGPSPAALLDSWPQPASAAPGRCLIEVAALPTFLSPFSWRVVAHSSDSYQIEDVNLLDRRFRTDALPSEALWRRAVRFPNTWTPVTADAARARTAQIFLGFSRMPAPRMSVDATGAASVEWTDLRFLTGPLMSRPRPRLATPFTVTVRLDADQRIIGERLGP